MKNPKASAKTERESEKKAEPSAANPSPTEAESASPSPLVEGRDFVLDEQGRFVLTAEYLRERGECCGSGCRNCPYG